MDKPARLSWRISNVKAKKSAVLEIYGVIGDPWDGVAASDFNHHVRSLDVERLDVLFNSPGGYVNDGLAIYNCLLGHPAEKHGYVEGAADSAASFVFQAMNRRVIAETASMFIHRAMGLVMGDEDDFVAAAEMMREHSKNIAGIYAERAGGTVDEWLERMSAGNSARRGTSYRGQEAVAIGLADEVGIYIVSNRDMWRVAAQSDGDASPPPPEPPAPAVDLRAALEAARLKSPAPTLQQLLEHHQKEPLTAAFGKGE